MAKKKKQEQNILSDEKIKYHIEARAKLLNGQLRGLIDKKAREENLNLIIPVLSEMFIDAFGEGVKVGYLTKLEEES